MALDLTSERSYTRNGQMACMEPKPPEVPVLPLIAAGDQQAVQKCIDRYKNLIWTIAFGRLNCRQTAEDVTQEIFLSLWQNADRFDEKLASEKVFVTMIARRRMIDLLRRRKLPQVEDDPDESLSFVSDKIVQPDFDIETQDEVDQVSSALSELPRDRQQAIRLSIVDGLSHTKISQTMGLSLGTVKTHIRRGLIELRSKLSSTH